MKKQRLDSSLQMAGLATTVLTGAVFVASSQVQAQDAKPEDKGWETSASAGVTLTRGNSKNFLATLSVDSSRKWSKDEALLGASAGYGKTTDVKRDDGLPDDENTTAAYAKGFGQYNHLFTERIYGATRAKKPGRAIAERSRRRPSAR
jgi:hypothetical protein